MVRGRTTGRGRGRGASAAASRTSTRGATAPRATRGATARFRPKNIRRDEAERDALAREEEKKANERAADERRARGRSRLRSKRSRGDAMGSRGGRVLTASGPFSSGFATSTSEYGGGGWGGGGGGGSGGGFGAANSAIGGSRAIKGSKEFNTIDAGMPQEARINADKLHNAAATPEDEFDSDDEAMRATLSSRGATIIPMGIYRKEHKETGVVVATTAELEAAEATGAGLAEEESLWVDGQEPTDMEAQPPEGGNWLTDASAPVQVKKEPGDDGDIMDVDVKPEVKQPALPIAETKPAKVLAQDPEEKMIQSDLSLLASELGAMTVSGEGDDAPADKDGRLYLFQFPPLLPPLKAVPPESNVKPEPSDDTAMADHPIAGGEPVDLTQTPDGATPAPGTSDDDDPEAENGFMSKLLSQGGLVGTLNVRKSGRVELDWGGRALEMSPATAMGFLTTAVIVEENDEKPGSDAIGGESIGMGKVMGRFVLAPVWEDEEEYEVPPEALEIRDSA
ncbi:hypothetical protein NLU13_1906 [Sarocladium strictum]|uniref:Uncharacterized protein n=1 Tax=Sarocladium strictum TaxID=5046 RepID=A0AA39GSN7_SARSR|nr:hypothetical protein NLU13_1906 [Sarocladium strictum]